VRRNNQFTRRGLPVLSLVLVVVLGGCASFRPQPLGNNTFWERVEIQQDGPVSVSVGVLNPEESLQAFDVKMYKHGIEPVWVRIENNDDVDYGFFPITLDPDYYSPYEAAWKCHFFGGTVSNRKMDDFFYDEAIPIYVRAGETIEGYVYTNLRSGVKVVNVDLIATGRVRRFEFIHEVPGLRVDYHDVDFENLYDSDDVIHVDQDGLRAALEDFPCCTLGPDRKTPGDPLNLVLVTSPERDGSLLAAFSRRGWDLTETITTGSSFKTAWSSMFGGEYKTSPVSALYVFDRPQDAALQKARKTVDQRNHLRLWLAPILCDGRLVWIGQISRDIGVRFSSKTIVTHKVDPNVDEAREYLVQDLILGQSVSKIGYVAGVGRATRDEPRTNFTKDPYFTDGLRVVFFLSDEPVSYDEIELLDWQWPEAGPNEEE
jgi:hypothetical protein